MRSRLLIGVVLSLAWPLCAEAGDTGFVMDMDGNVLGQRRNAAAECDHLMETPEGRLPTKEWRACYDDVLKHNDGLSNKRLATNREIIAKRREGTDNRRGSLEDDLNANQATALGILSGDGIVSSGGYANSVTNAIARATVGGKRIFDMAQGNMGELDRAMNQFDTAGATSTSTSSIYGQDSRTAFSSYSGDGQGLEAPIELPPADVLANAIREYEEERVATQKRSAEERRIAEAKRTEEQRRAEQGRSQKEVEQRRSVNNTNSNSNAADGDCKEADRRQSEKFDQLYSKYGSDASCEAYRAFYESAQEKLEIMERCLPVFRNSYAADSDIPGRMYNIAKDGVENFRDLMHSNNCN